MSNFSGIAYSRTIFQSWKLSFFAVFFHSLVLILKCKSVWWVTTQIRYAHQEMSPHLVVFQQGMDKLKSITSILPGQPIILKLDLANLFSRSSVSLGMGLCVACHGIHHRTSLLSALASSSLIYFYNTSIWASSFFMDILSSCMACVLPTFNSLNHTWEKKLWLQNSTKWLIDSCYMSEESWSSRKIE